ncbi:MAG TPA: hypothetical protein DD420_29855 [Streptomyces sp.]|nr:hypothetical protein [Streptomyces sp.]
MGLFSNKTFAQELQDEKAALARHNQHRIEDEFCGFKAAAEANARDAAKAADRIAQLEELESYRAR